jgi:hypothetical protein
MKRPMNTSEEDAQVVRLLAVNEQELHIEISTRGPDFDKDVPALMRSHDGAPMENLEKALFGASLDDIMNFSDFMDLAATTIGASNCEARASTRSPSPTCEPINHFIRTIGKRT